MSLVLDILFLFRILYLSFDFPPSSDTSNLPLETTAHLFSLSCRASSTLIPTGNLRTTSLFTSNRRAFSPAIGCGGSVVVIGFQDFLGCYEFRSKTHQDEFSPEGLCKAAMFALFVKEELGSWPEQSTRNRSWLTVPEAFERCRHEWMRVALNSFSRWDKDCW